MLYWPDGDLICLVTDPRFGSDWSRRESSLLSNSRGLCLFRSSGCNSWCCRLASRSNITQSFNYKRKRFRTAFTAAQMNRLESSFRRNRYAIGSERRLLARDLGLTETQVYNFIMLVSPALTKASSSSRLSRLCSCLKQTALPLSDIVSHHMQHHMHHIAP